MPRTQPKPASMVCGSISVTHLEGARLPADALGQPRGAERKDRRSDRLLERSVAARQLRGDRATVLRVARHR